MNNRDFAIAADDDGNADKQNNADASIGERWRRHGPLTASDEGRQAPAMPNNSRTKRHEAAERMASSCWRWRI